MAPPTDSARPAGRWRQADRRLMKRRKRGASVSSAWSTAYWARTWVVLATGCTPWVLGQLLRVITGCTLYWASTWSGYHYRVHRVLGQNLEGINTGCTMYWASGLEGYHYRVHLVLGQDLEGISTGCTLYWASTWRVSLQGAPCTGPVPGGYHYSRGHPVLGQYLEGIITAGCTLYWASTWRDITTGCTVY